MRRRQVYALRTAELVRALKQEGEPKPLKVADIVAAVPILERNAEPRNTYRGRGKRGKR